VNRNVVLFSVTVGRCKGFFPFVFTGEDAASVNYVLVSGVKKVKRM
jgi:hypothetical protein